jgi:hypothetical protein
VGDVCIGVEFTFITPLHISFLLQKVYTLFYTQHHFCLAKLLL